MGKTEDKTVVTAVLSSSSAVTGDSQEMNWQTGRRARCSSVVRAFAHGAMGRRIDPSWGGPIEQFFVSASAQRLV